ncbi:MAG: HAMP domain-containing sensor histidine kinase [Clostridium sp.]|nr:HAMP domain-containing sensor histidine kinase [Clostridium sp.]
MKLFWKIFFSVMIICVSCFSIGSYILINNNFKTSLDREIKNTYTENEILNGILSQELADVSDMYIQYSEVNSGKEGYTKSKWIRQVAPNININSGNGKMLYRIVDVNGELIYENLKISFKDNLINKLDKQTKGHEITALNGKYYIQVGVPLDFTGDLYYIENFSDITEIFNNQKEQYKTFLYITIIMIVIGGTLSFIISFIILKPIYRLSRASKEISKGNYSQRVHTNASDETGELANSFNVMAENLCTTVNELKDVNMRQESFIGCFAHEIKTPLTSMIGYADMLRSRKLSQEEVIISSNYIFEEGKRIEFLSMKLLDLIMLKKQNFKMHNVFSIDFFEEVEGVMFPNLSKYNITFLMNVEECILQIEPDFMKTVFINIIDNSIKAIARKYDKKAKEAFNEEGIIKLSGKRVGSDFIIEIVDNGKGMEKKELSRITDPFYMIDKSRARSQGGAGLGLSICVEVIKLHNGEIIFESEINKGTKVSIILRGVVIDEEQ